MFIEEFYNYDGKSDEQIVRIIYETTLTSWLIFNEEEVYLEMIETFEEQENYLACEGIKRAIDKVNEVMDRRFDEATKIAETEDEALLTIEEHKRVSQLIYQDILKEIYENRIRTIKGND
jgi:hypothetical protein